LRIFSSIFLLFFTLHLGAQVTFTGYLVDEKNNKIKDVEVNLYQGNDLISTKNWNKKFEYTLDNNQYYTIELVKKGFIPKKIAVSTFEGDKGAEPFMFVMELIKEKKGVDSDALEFPSAMIQYDKGSGAYNFNVDYSKNIKKDQKKALKKGKD